MSAGLDLDAIEARANAATRGPWTWITDRMNDRYSTLTKAGTRRPKPGHRLRETWVGLLAGPPRGSWGECHDPATYPDWLDEWDFPHVYGLRWNWLKAGSVDGSATFHPPDKEFIAHARTDVPALVAEVRRTRTLLVQLMEADVAFDRRLGLSTRKEMRPMERVSTVREPTVQFYRDDPRTPGHISFATVTTATEADEFLMACAESLVEAMDDPVIGASLLLHELLPQICNIWAKLRGYKAERVYEQRLLIAGVPNPASHMQAMVPASRYLVPVNGQASDAEPATP